VKIKYVKAKNFLSIGEEPIEIDFTKYGNIINIKGYNLDSGEGSSNAAGKTTLLESIVYGLYGKLLKGLNHKEAINIKSKKGLEVEIHWDDYRVIRKREPNRLQLWHGDKDISLGGIPATDELIRNIIGLDYNSFINVSCFGQHNVKPFLSCDAAEKRQIAENLLSLDKYQKYHKVAKEKTKAIKDRMGQLSMQYQASLSEITSVRKRQNALTSQNQGWRESKLREIGTMEIKVRSTLDSMDKINSRTEVKEYHKVKEELLGIELEIDKRDKIRTDLHAILTRADAAISQRQDEKQAIMLEISLHERTAAMISGNVAALEQNCLEIKEKKNGTCPACFGRIDDTNVKACIDHNLAKIKTHQVHLVEANKKKDELAAKLKTCDESLQKILDGRLKAREKETFNLSTLNSLISKRKDLARAEKPDSVAETDMLKRDLAYLEERLDVAKKELDSGGPYMAMMKMAEEELYKAEEQSKDYKNQLSELDSSMPYYEFWVRAFGDEGIRAFVINEIIPSLNSRINYWLQFLMDGKIQVKFNNELEETISRVPIDKDPFVYNSLSGGEHGRIDLAISQAFAHVMMMTSGTCPSFVGLDEVGANIDRPGIHAIYSMICEMARERQVIIITHDPDLLDLLSGYETIEVVKKNGITTLRKN
jgi:DNA repair exonuclease SbcCD ATPase subunit